MMTIAVPTNPVYQAVPDRYIILRDNDTHLDVLDRATNQECIRTAEEILFSGEYQFYSKNDIAKIGYILGKDKKLELIRRSL